MTFFRRGARKESNVFALVPFFVVLSVAILAAGPVTAADSWGAALFPVKRHDFGRTAIGADAEFRFELENIYVQDVKLLGVQSSCGCTNASISTKLLKSSEKGAVIAKLNTSGQHTREKSATLSVQLETVVDGRVLRDTVQLFVTAYIRPDVVLTPGIVEFGAVREGQSVARTLMLEYAGRSDWALTKIERNSPFVHARAEEIKRTGGEVAYQITVTLKDSAPVGYVKDTLRFATNERKPGSVEPSEIVLPIQGVVMAPIHARPSPFLVGIVAPGESVAKSIVVRSDTPFRITRVDSDDKRFRFTFADEESHIQIVSVLFSAKNIKTAGPVDLVNRIRIRTNLSDQEFVTVDAHTRIEPGERPAETVASPEPTLVFQDVRGSEDFSLPR